MITKAQAQAKIDAAFDNHIEKLVDVLCTDLAFDPTRAAEYVGNFHRGLANGAKAQELVAADLGTIFPE